MEQTNKITTLIANWEAENKLGAGKEYSDSQLNDLQIFNCIAADSSAELLSLDATGNMIL